MKGERGNHITHNSLLDVLITHVHKQMAERKVDRDEKVILVKFSPCEPILSTKIDGHQVKVVSNLTEIERKLYRWGVCLISL